ncbi:hypothetical protein PGT21_035140 [Puccinia graminis f. sp. tritici]|uniref:Uncharacterized protein n=1 Tax=Puccinia graminis f. sp. tritici TaxID=56615 RepID=A0A5B0PPX4_PUCGR|nr:hypothetical protein PGT21_035140 [Puccinia graminis f. sp. tritici]
MGPNWRTPLIFLVHLRNILPAKSLVPSEGHFDLKRVESTKNLGNLSEHPLRLSLSLSIDDESSTSPQLVNPKLAEGKKCLKLPDSAVEAPEAQPGFKPISSTKKLIEELDFMAWSDHKSQGISRSGDNNSAWYQYCDKIGVCQPAIKNEHELEPQLSLKLALNYPEVPHEKQRASSNESKLVSGEKGRPISFNMGQFSDIRSHSQIDTQTVEGNPNPESSNTVHNSIPESNILVPGTTKKDSTDLAPNDIKDSKSKLKLVHEATISEFTDSFKA